MQSIVPAGTLNVIITTSFTDHFKRQTVGGYTWRPGANTYGTTGEAQAPYKAETRFPWKWSRIDSKLFHLTQMKAKGVRPWDPPLAPWSPGQQPQHGPGSLLEIWSWTLSLNRTPPGGGWYAPRCVSSSAPEKLVQSSKCALVTTETSILKMQTECFNSVS